MIDRTEWLKASREVAAENDRRSEPPTEEELLAYGRGELAEEEEERIREYLVAHPNEARVLALPFPDMPKEGDPDFIPEEEIAAAWARLQPRLERAPAAPIGSMKPADAARVVPMRSRRDSLPWAVAATVALVFGGLWFQAERKAGAAEDLAIQPRVVKALQVLDSDGRRGTARVTMLRRVGDAYSVRLPLLVDQPGFASHRIEIVTLPARAILWKTTTDQPNRDNAFDLVIPHRFLPPGDYEIRIFGIDGEREERRGVYRVRVERE